MENRQDMQQTWRNKKYVQYFGLGTSRGGLSRQTCGKQEIRTIFWSRNLTWGTFATDLGETCNANNILVQKPHVGDFGVYETIVLKRIMENISERGGWI
jgi:hypothetical protein